MSDWRTLSTVEGQPLLGGTGTFRTRETVDSGLLYEIRYPAGVGSPEHRHDHDSTIYLLSGELRGTIDGREVRLAPGETVVHPRDVPHTVEAVVDSHWLEFKSPLPWRTPLST
ncbi:cupin domain-containing protein [Amycolatopsis magusensis]|uniref:cupin domain-containing protein n=1 Tax=Amycolatopsis magusensis TaxID=882444 RepID=UPI0024A89E11|nr:cupin domain-containing protein [Amycolatopsis magusensis]MDI5982075.1 cupin domain-containing protein [Amycolatopsis magusensis]